MATNEEVETALSDAKLAVLLRVKKAAENSAASGATVASHALAYRYLAGGEQPVITEAPAK